MRETPLPTAASYVHALMLQRVIAKPAWLVRMTPPHRHGPT